MDTDAAAHQLRRYYGETSEGVPRYSGARFESIAALNSDPNTLGPADFVAVSMLSVEVSGQAAIRLLGRDAPTISELLRQIPTDVDIVDVDTALLRAESPADELWYVLRRGQDGVGPTTTSKLMAAKRPRLLPIWDSFVERATGLGTLGYWEKMQYVLNEDHRLVWHWLGDLKAEVPEMPASVSELRMLDVLLWMSVEAVAARPLRA